MANVQSHTKIEEFSNYESVAEQYHFSFWEYLNTKADYQLAIAFSKLFWPEFITFNNYVLLAEHYNQEALATWESQGLSQSDIEKVINHVHVYDLFLNTETENIQMELFEYLGKLLYKLWGLALKETFPDKKFQISYQTEPDAYGPTITFWQI